MLVIMLLLGYSIRLPGIKITDLQRVFTIAAVAIEFWPRSSLLEAAQHP